MKKPVLIGLIIAVVVIIGAIVVATNKNSMGSMSMHHDGTTSDTSTAVATNMVSIASYAFSPSIITVKAGTKVTWTNKDAVKHTVTSETGGPMSELFGRDETYSYNFDMPGTYAYHCEPHPYMKGTVVVTN